MGAALLMLGAGIPSGCALASKGEALSPRFFSPVPPAERTPSAGLDAPGPSAHAPELRMGRIEPAAHLEERIAYRLSATELAYYEDRRWTEPPEQFVRRALEKELFERRAFRRILSGDAPTLDVEVLSFEELRFEGRERAARARLGLLVTLRDERHALLERTIGVEAPIGASGDAGPALAAAMAVALGEATEQITALVSQELEKRSASPPSVHDPRASGDPAAAAVNGSTD